MKKLSIVIPIHILDTRVNDIILMSHLIPESFRIIMVYDRPKLEIQDVTTIQLVLNSANIELIQGDFGGPGQARNAGMEQCNTEFVAFWDSDDRPNILHFTQMLNKIMVDNYDVVIGSFAYTKFSMESNTVLHRKISSDWRTQIALLPGIWRMIFRTDFIGNIKFPSIRMGEDQVFLCLLNMTEGEIGFFDKVVYYYSISSEGQLTSKKHWSSDLTIALEHIYANIKYKERKSAKIERIMFNKLLVSCLLQMKTVSEFLAILKLFCAIGISNLSRITLNPLEFISLIKYKFRSLG